MKLLAQIGKAAYGFYLAPLEQQCYTNDRHSTISRQLSFLSEQHFDNFMVPYSLKTGMQSGVKITVYASQILLVSSDVLIV